MRLFILVCYLVITVFMIAVILFQRSEASAGLGGGTMGGMMTARGTANLLTRLTAVLAALFMGANLFLAYLEKQESARSRVQELSGTKPSLEQPKTETPGS
ncbi:MAG: preprotein translocase subunit SecG [Holosporales bacterium]